MLFGTESTVKEFKVWWSASQIPHQLTVPPRTYHHGRP